MGLSKSYFPDSYAESRAWFRDQLGRIREYWPTARMSQHALSQNPDLTIDWIQASPPATGGKMLVISTGLHGAEGFAGTAVISLLLTSFLEEVNRQRTGILVIHGINPWGMTNRRRTNANNVDLNRNFRFVNHRQTPLANEGYRTLQEMLHPVRPLRNYSIESTQFFLRSLLALARMGTSAFRSAVLLGQRGDPGGPYFAGCQLQEESQVAWELLTGSLEGYRQVIHVDVHTGYGPKGTMTLVNSTHEPSSPEECTSRFGYPHVVQTDSESFYAIQGDMIDAVYRWAYQNSAQGRYFGTAFEFGTIGDGVLSQLRSLRATIFENQLHQHGSTSAKTLDIVRSEFRKLSDPPSETWRQSVVASSAIALRGILDWYGLLRGQA